MVETNTPVAPKAQGPVSSDDKLMGAIAYIGILFLIPLLVKKDSNFAQFHAKQGLVLFVAEVILGVVGWVLIFIPVLGWVILMLLSVGLGLLSLIALIQAAMGVEWKLPLGIGDIAAKIKI